MLSLIRFLPYWALPLAFAFLEVAMFLRRRKKPSQFLFFGMTGFFSFLSVIWLIGRGDQNAVFWVRDFLGN